MTALRILAALTLGLLVAVNASAHRQSGVVTRMAWSDSDQALHITHRLHAHDALQLLPQGTALDSLDGRALLALYVEANYAVSTAQPATAAALTLVGAETDGDDVYVYQTLALAQPPRALQVVNTLLADVAGAANTLVFVVDGKTQSKTAPPSTDWLQIAAASETP